MKIAFLIPNFNNGGAQNTLIKIANLMHEKGHEVVVISMSLDGPMIVRVNRAVKIVCIKSPRARFALLGLYRELVNSRPDWLITSLMAPSLLALLAKILLFKRLRIILREASTPSSEKLKTLKSILLFYIFKYLCRIADRIVAVSKGVKSDFSEFYKIPYEMIEVIYNPVIFNWTQHIRNARPKYSGPPRLIFVGRIVRLKRLELQIEALSILIKKIPGVTLIICGDSPDLQYSDELVELANRLGVYKNIEFVGYQENVYSQLSRADYILLTSEYEGLPSVLIEALSVGVRVVACDCPNGPREILDNGRLGYLIPYDGLTAEAVANAIIRDALSPQKINFQDNHFIQFESEHVINQYLALMYAHNV